MIRLFAFALAFAVLPVAALAGSRVEIEINDSETGLDDYICYGPTKARARAITDESSSVPVTLTAESKSSSAIQFLAFTGEPAVRSQVNPVAKLDMLLPSDGSWVPFSVIGMAPSAADKDIQIVAKLTADASKTIGTQSLMVRVRKDAETLTETEKDQFLSALEKLHGHKSPIGPTEDVMKYASIHDMAFQLGIHNGAGGFPLFLAWHRAFLLSLERELQAIDPRVALPYWRFDKDSQNIFTENFMGRVEGEAVASGLVVKFSQTNPLEGWKTRADGLLRRVNNGDKAITQFTWDGSTPMIQEVESIFVSPGASWYGGVPPSRGINARLELTYHNGAHAHVDGWLGSGSSPRDPLFFLLHANVDRTWAHWQEKNSRYDRNATESYSLQGAYPVDGDPNRLRESSYLNDPMWPWSGKNGSETPGDLEDDWPTRGFFFPKAPSGFNPEIAPTPGDMVDYMNMLGGSVALSMCYDHLGYFGER